MSLMSSLPIRHGVKSIITGVRFFHVILYESSRRCFARGPKMYIRQKFKPWNREKGGTMIKLMYLLYVLCMRIRMVWRSLSQVVLKAGWPTPNTPWSGYLGIGNNCFCQETNNQIRQKCLFKHRLNLYLRLLPKAQVHRAEIGQARCNGLWEVVHQWDKWDKDMGEKWQGSNLSMHSKIVPCKILPL